MSPPPRGISRPGLVALPSAPDRVKHLQEAITQHCTSSRLHPKNHHHGELQDGPDGAVQAGGRYVQQQTGSHYHKRRLTAHVSGPESHTSETVGKITSVLTEPGQQAGRNVQASEENPRYEVGRLLLASPRSWHRTDACSAVRLRTSTPGR